MRHTCFSHVHWFDFHVRRTRHLTRWSFSLSLSLFATKLRTIFIFSTFRSYLDNNTLPIDSFSQNKIHNGQERGEKIDVFQIQYNSASHTAFSTYTSKCHTTIYITNILISPKTVTAVSETTQTNRIEMLCYCVNNGLFSNLLHPNSYSVCSRVLRIGRCD